MKTCVRIGTLVIALGLAGLFTGCGSRSSSAYFRQSARDFEVVETSAKRQLTDREMAYLRAKVDAYLREQGQTGSGDYYVKIYLAEEEGAGQSEWVIVRFSRYPTTRFSLVAAYPAYSHPRYPSYTYDYYPFGWSALSGLSFRYYDDPYYYGHYPRYSGHWRNRDRKPDHRHDHDRDDDKDDDQPRTDRRPSGALKPSFVPANMQHPRSENASPGHNPRDPRERDERHPLPPRERDRRNWPEPRNNPASPNLANNPEPTAPTVATGAMQPARPTTRSALHREHGPSGVARPGRSEVAEQRSDERREHSYAPPPRAQPGVETRGNDSNTQERSSSRNPPATRSELHGSRQPREP